MSVYQKMSASNPGRGGGVNVLLALAVVLALFAFAACEQNPPDDEESATSTKNREIYNRYFAGNWEYVQKSSQQPEHTIIEFKEQSMTLSDVAIDFEHLFSVFAEYYQSANSYSGIEPIDFIENNSDNIEETLKNNGTILLWMFDPTSQNAESIKSQKNSSYVNFSIRFDGKDILYITRYVKKGRTSGTSVTLSAKNPSLKYKRVTGDGNGSGDAVDISGKTYTITVNGNDCTLVFDAGGTYTFTPYTGSNTKTGSWSTNGGKLTMGYSVSGYSDGNETFTMTRTDGGLDITLDGANAVSLVLNSFGLATKSAHLVAQE